MESNTSVKELSVRLSSAAYEQLVSVQQTTGAKALEDVVREAFRVYDGLVTDAAAGKTITIHDPQKPDAVDVLKLF